MRRIHRFPLRPTPNGAAPQSSRQPFFLHQGPLSRQRRVARREATWRGDAGSHGPEAATPPALAFPRNHAEAVALFHCMFDPTDGTVHHRSEEIPDERLAELPNTYAVCVADRRESPRQVLAGFIARTALCAEDEADALAMALGSIPELDFWAETDAKLLQARLPFDAGVALTEDEMLRIMLQLYMQFSASGSG